MTMSFDDRVRALFARQPNRMVPDLARISTLCELLGRPDQAFPAVQVSGTNGKTTTAHMISALLHELGVTAGTYTSPHLQDVRERIRVAGELISEEEFAERLGELAPFLAEIDSRFPDLVTFFEVLTALAFVHFADKPVEAGVFEVGMGGRWDATNLVRGEVAVLTEVSLDHIELGVTPAEVALEKAGIIKEGGVTVSAVQQPDVARVLAAAAEEKDSQLVVAGRDFRIEDRRLAVGGQYLSLAGVTGTVDEVFLPLQGAHQAMNAAVALAAVEGFLGFAGGIDPELIRAAFASVRSPGRLEVVRREAAATVILDGAHNLAGAQALARALTEEFAARHRVLVLGVLDDKDVEAMAAAIAPLVAHVIVTEPPSGRAAPADRVEKAVRATGISVEVAPDVALAIEAASGVATEEDLVVVTGSLYMVGAARTALGLSAV